MGSPETAAPAVEGAHTVFLVTNFWESMSEDIEYAQGKAVADASKAAGVKHIIFSSLINVKEASKGRLAKVKHFDSKAKIEDYIRSLDISATFVQPGMYMSSFFNLIRKGEDGTYTWAHPTPPDEAKLPLFDPLPDLGLWNKNKPSAEHYELICMTVGKYVKIALKNFPGFAGKRIRAAHHYYTSTEMIDQWSKVTGKQLKYAYVPPEQFLSFLPPKGAEELVETLQLMAAPGYYDGADVTEATSLLDESPTTWSDFVNANKDKW